MEKYLNSLNDEIRNFFSILSKDFPDWLFEYIDTIEMQRIGKIGMNCGTDYTNLYNNKYFYSNLEHSVGVALIIWDFTKDKKQTLAGLFHDIATPAFKHCVDFMNGDSETQESTEEMTEYIILNSKDIMSLLKRDNIDVKDILDYKIYPIADNNTPRLAADRFEYNFSSGLCFKRVWDLDRIKRCYDNVIVLVNEDGLEELGFKDIEVAEEYIKTVSNLWPEWVTDKNRVTMQFIADIVKSMNVKGYLNLDDLYNKSEKDIVNIILSCDDEYISDSFKKFQSLTDNISSDYEIKDKYCVCVKSKKRYIDPLVKTSNGIFRLSKVSKIGKDAIDRYLNMETHEYSALDIEFKPYKQEKKLRKEYNG